MRNRESPFQKRLKTTGLETPKNTYLNAPAILTLEDTFVLQDLIEILGCFNDVTKK